MLLPALLAVALVLPATAKAAGPQHSTFSGTATGVDVCGISTTLTFSGADNFWPVFDSSGNLVAFTDNHQEHDVFTAANGKAVEVHFAQRATNTFTANPDGTFTQVFNLRGLLEQVSAPSGPVLTQSAGMLVFVDVLDSSGDLLSQTFTVEKGLQPEADSGFTLFCQTVTPLLS
jgi:hypothetical protein